MKLLRIGLLPVLLVTALLAGGVATVGASGAPGAGSEGSTELVLRTAATDPATVCAGLSTATTANEALPELCRLYTGGTLPDAAKTVIGRVIVKLSEKTRVKVPKATPTPFDAAQACQALPASTDPASAAAVFCHALKSNGTPAAACTALAAQPTLLPRLQKLCEQIKAGKTPDLRSVIHSQQVAKPVSKPKVDRKADGERRKAKPTPTATATATASPTPSPTPSGG